MKPKDGYRESENRELLELLMDEYGDSIKRLAYSYTKNWDMAEDITQEVFITCYIKLDGFREESSYKTWLYRITINKCKDLLKTKWLQNIVQIDKFMSYFKSNLTVEEEVVKKNEEEELAALIFELPLKYREIIILYYYEQLKIREIHSLTGLNIETIKSRLRRGKKMLYDKLLEEEEEYEKRFKQS